MDELLKNHTFATHVIAAMGSLTLSTALTYPLDTLKSLIQVGSSSGTQLTTTQVVSRIQRLSGYSGLYSGFGSLALGRTFGFGTRFGTYEILTAFNKDGREDNHVYVNEAFIAGVTAGALESVITSPFELIKIRAQVTSASRAPCHTATVLPQSLTRSLLRNYAPDIRTLNQSVGLLSTLNTKYPNMIDALKEYPWMISGSGNPPPVTAVVRSLDIVSLEGWGAFWRGLRSGLVRDSVFGGVFFASWQFLHIALLDWKAAGMKPPPRYNEEVGPLSPVTVSVAAGFSGAIAAAASHRFDTAKSRSQCTVLPKYLSMERKLLKWSRPGKWFEKATGIHPADRKILSRGIWHRMARCGISSFVLVGGYYWAIDHLVFR